MKTINLEKLIKEKKASFTGINPNKKYLILVDSNSVTFNDLTKLSETMLMKEKCIFMIVNGKPDEVISMYEIKK